jgi:hypothetical protein
MANLRRHAICLVLVSAPYTAALQRSHISKYSHHIVVVIDFVQSRPDWQWFLICCSERYRSCSRAHLHRQPMVFWFMMRSSVVQWNQTSKPFSRMLTRYERVICFSHVWPRAAYSLCCQGFL